MHGTALARAMLAQGLIIAIAVLLAWRFALATLPLAAALDDWWRALAARRRRGGSAA